MKKILKYSFLASLVASPSFAGINLSGYILSTAKDVKHAGQLGADNKVSNAEKAKNGKSMYNQYELTAAMTKTARNALTFGSEFILYNQKESSIANNNNANIDGNLFILNTYGLIKLGTGHIDNAVKTKAANYVRNSFNVGQIDHTNRIYARQQTTLSTPEGYIIRRNSAVEGDIKDSRNVWDSGKYSNGAYYFETSKFWGFSAAYSSNNTTARDLREETSVAVNYNNNIYGADLNIGYGQTKNLGGGVTFGDIGEMRDRLFSAKISYSGVSGSYSTNQSRYQVAVHGLSNHDIKTRDHRYGFGLDVRGLSASYVVIREANIYDLSQPHRISDAYSIKYTLVDGLDVGGTYESSGFDGSRTFYFGAQVTF